MRTLSLSLSSLSRVLPQVKRSLKEEILKPRYSDAVGTVVNSVLLEQGLAARLCNNLYMHEERRADLTTPPNENIRDLPTSFLFRPTGEELNMITLMNEKWAMQLHMALLSHCEEMGRPLMRLTSDMSRGGGGRSGRGAKWLYTSDDLLLLLESVRHPNQASRKGGKDWSLTPVALWTPRLPQLRQMFAELAPTERQCGLDDELRGWFAEERNAVGGRLLTTSYAPLLMQYARCGVPPGLRGRMWLGALRLGTVSERDYNYFATLQREIGRVTLATDDMVKKDAMAPSKEEDYFVFADLIEEVLLAFCRDPTVSQLSAEPKPEPIIARDRFDNRVTFPPSGVPPFKGLADFVCPLCFVYARPPELYFCFREMWARYWSKLHSFSSSPGSLLPLLRLFEDLLQECAPAVCLHLLRLELPPGKLAVHWIASGFASFLPAEQTLVLWDRIIGFDSLELLPILAAAVFVYRAKWLLQASEASHLHRLLADATGLKVVPLLQLFLADCNQLVCL